MKRAELTDRAQRGVPVQTFSRPASCLQRPSQRDGSRHHTVSDLPETSHKSTISITQCYLPQVNILDLPIPEEQKAELTWPHGYTQRWFTCSQTVSHPSSNQARMEQLCIALHRKPISKPGSITCHVTC